MENTCKTYWAKIYIAGPIDVAKQVLRLLAKKKGMCVTIEPTTFIYTGGEEEGYVVGLINYPRFLRTEKEIWDAAIELAHTLREQTGQDSFTVMAPDNTFWCTDRQ